MWRISKRFVADKVELIFINGAPGTGKGTLCKHAVEQTKFSPTPFGHISIGDLLRQELSKQPTSEKRSYLPGSYLSQTIKEAIENATVLPSYITTGLLLDEVEKRRQQSKSTEIMLLVDGFPRNIENIHELQKAQLSYLFWNTLITLECSKEIIFERLLSNSRQRDDDKEEILLKRLNSWEDGSYQQVENYFISENDKIFQSFNTNSGTTNIYNFFFEFVTKTQKIQPKTLKFQSTNLIENFKEGEMPSYVYSYPTKKAYSLLSSSEYLNEENIISKAWHDYDGPLNIYIHIPYCQMKCSFCNLFTTMNFNEEKSDRYVESLKLEINNVFSKIKQNSIESIHFGGGTPSLIHPNKLNEILQCLNKFSNLSKVKEIAIEATPASIYSNSSLLSEYSKIGISRLSIGVQTFDPQELTSVNREKEIGYSEDVLQSAVQSSYFKNINCDLIFGLPGQTKTVFLENIQKAIDLKVHTITLYCLAIRQKTKFGRIKKTQNDDECFFTNDELFDWYQCAVDLLENSGFPQKTLVLFGRGNKQEEIEFEGVPTLGLGAGARSYSPFIHYSSDNYFSSQLPHEIISHYYNQIENQKLSILSYVCLSKDEQMRKCAIMQLLYYKGIDLHYFRQKFKQLFESTFSTEYHLLLDNGLASIVFEDHRPFLRLHKNLKYSSAIAQLFFSDAIKNSESSYK